MPVINSTLVCSKCKKAKHRNEFYKRSERKRGRHSKCKQCEKEYASQPDVRKKLNDNTQRYRDKLRATDFKEFRRREREQNLRKYGINSEQFEDLKRQQNGRCKICENIATYGKGKKLHVDHDHITGKIRGLLCSNCNLGLGYFQDNRDLLNKAIAYLEENS